jgi:hypothetical protein
MTATTFFRKCIWIWTNSRRGGSGKPGGPTTKPRRESANHTGPAAQIEYRTPNVERPMSKGIPNTNTNKKQETRNFEQGTSN